MIWTIKKEVEDVLVCRGGLSWINSASLIGDDELGGAFGRVQCIGGRPAFASKQWVPGNGCRLSKWLALGNYKLSYWINLRDSAELRRWRLAVGSSTQTAFERTSFSRNDIIGAASHPEAPGQRRTVVLSTNWGPAHEFSIASRAIGPAFPKLPDLVGCGKALKADPGKRRSAAKRTALQCGFKRSKRHLNTCEAPASSSTSVAATRLQDVRSCAKECRCCGCYSNAFACSLELE